MRSLLPLRTFTMAPLIVMLVWIAGCHSSVAEAPAVKLPEVDVTTVHRSAVAFQEELPGRTSAYLVAQVRARVDGIVLKREFVEGANVKANQKLYQIDPAPYQAALDSALAVLQNAQANVVTANALADRYKVLIAAKAVSRQELDNAIAAQGQAIAMVAAGKASVEAARINLRYTDIVSPVAGQTGISLVTQGAYVQASAATLLTTVQQIDPIYVDLSQSSVAGLQLRRNVASGKLKPNEVSQASVALTLEDGTQYPVAGRLEFSDITVDAGTGSVTVRAVFPNPRHVLLPGMFVRCRIDEGTEENGVLVPQTGVTHDAKGQATVFVVGANEEVALRVIQTSRTLGDQWVAIGGLSDGERVVTTGVQRIRAGIKVNAVNVPAAGGIPALSGAKPDTSVTGK